MAHLVLLILIHIIIWKLLLDLVMHPQGKLIFKIELFEKQLAYNNHFKIIILRLLDFYQMEKELYLEIIIKEWDIGLDSLMGIQFIKIILYFWVLNLMQVDEKCQDLFGKQLNLFKYSFNVLPQILQHHVIVQQVNIGI